VELTGGANKTSVSNEQGIFIFRNLKPNTYQVRCELEGFKTVIQKNIHVASGRNSHLNVMMETASIQQEVVITGQATVIDTRKTTVGVNVSREAVETIAEDNLYQIDGISSTDPSAGTRPKGVNFDSVSDSIGGGTKAGSRPHKTKASEIVIKPWDPETPYMKSLTKAGPKEAFDSYMKLKAIYGKSPGFYLDCSDYFCKQNQLETGLQVLSNIAEMELGSAFFLRVYGHRLARLGYLKRSVEVFREVVEIRPDEPQSYRDLALVSAQLGRYKEAVELLYKVVTRDWTKGKRYSDIEIISLMEMNRIIAKAGKNFDANIDARLIKLLDVDIRIVLSWDSGATDIDLYIKDPNGEQSDFQNTLTRIGGLHSKDNTNGYGPEEFVLKNAVPGKYIIEGDYFGTNDDKLPGPVTLNLDFYTNYGRKNEKKKSITLRLSTVDETIVIGEIIF
ncbi:MAG: DUF2135 domain-containing protein, partial [bacterium]|nr:DUF2135 domain-containing protein [bacterium]